MSSRELLRQWFHVLLGATVLVGLGCQPRRSEWVRLEPGVSAPAFTLPQLEGGTLSLADLKGKVVIMEFWATWCGPCRQSVPSLDSVYRRYRDRGVVVLLINQGETAEQIRRWMGRRLVAPILLDADETVGQLYEVSGIPQLYVVSQEGEIIYDHGGYGGGLEFNLSVILNELLETDRPEASRG